MINGDILTALKNAVEHGESLDYAKKVLINSGYNSKEVEEASRFVGRGVIPNLQSRPDDILIPKIPQKKGFFQIFKKQAPEKNPKVYTQESIKYDAQKIKEEISPEPIEATNSSDEDVSLEKTDFQEETEVVRPARQYLKEIILLIILIFLTGVLITTLLFKEKILQFFSGI